MNPGYPPDDPALLYAQSRREHNFNQHLEDLRKRFNGFFAGGVNPGRIPLWSAATLPPKELRRDRIPAHLRQEFQQKWDVLIDNAERPIIEELIDDFGDEYDPYTRAGDDNIPGRGEKRRLGDEAVAFSSFFRGVEALRNDPRFAPYLAEKLE